MASQQPPILTLTVAIVGVRFFGISRSAFRYAERIMSHSAVFTSLTSVRANLFSRIATTPISLMRDLIEGSLIKKVVDDVERAQEFQLRTVLPRMSALISVIVGSALGVWIAPQSLFFTIPAFVIFFLAIPVIHRLRVVKPAFFVEDRESELANLLAISAAEVKEAEIFGYLPALIEQRQTQIRNITFGEIQLVKRISYLQFLSLVTLGTVLLGAIVMARQLTDAPSVRITMLIFLPLVIYEAISAWYPSLFTSAKLIRAQKSIDEISEYPPSSQLEVKQPDSQNIVAQNVQVSWRNGFMKPISFSATPEFPLLIQGSNGSGKSTLALGIAGLLPYRGSISICNQEVSTIENLEDFISSSLQNSHIFNTSLRENLKIAHQQASDVELLEILESLELGDISLDTVIGEFGRRLSGGEAKRVGVARALISRAPLVILDEPLEHVDIARAARLEETILKNCQQRTLIVIAHSGWKNLTNRVVLER